MRCKLCGASNAVSSVWCKLCGASCVVKAMQCNLCGRLAHDAPTRRPRAATGGLRRDRTGESRDSTPTALRHQGCQWISYQPSS
eukprot:5716065-Pyramimonas_sp.AAC.1